MKNKKNTTFGITYRMVKHIKKGDGVQLTHTLEYFCCGGGHVLISEYHGLMKNHKIIASHLHNKWIEGGYKLTHLLYDSANHEKFDDIEIHTNVL